MVLQHIDAAQRKGRNYAELDAQEAGRTPWDSDGASLLPTEPLEYDWKEFESIWEGLYDREPTKQEREAFFSHYREAMEQERGKRFSNHLRAVTAALGWTQKDTAAALDTCRMTVHRWMQRETIPDRRAEQAIINRLHRACKTRAAKLNRVTDAVDQEDPEED